MQRTDGLSDGDGNSDGARSTGQGCGSAKDPDPAPGGLPRGVDERQWGDWRWQMRHRVRTPAQLEQQFPSLKDRSDLPEVVRKYPMAITPYYASLIQRADSSDPVFQMSVPQGLELCDPSFLKGDPLEEEEDMPVPGLVHRYPDRALLIATTTCSMYCRHCTRKRVAGTRESTISACRLEQVRAYLTAHPEIRDVIVSGGDPLTMGTEAIEAVLKVLRGVSSIEIIRVGTRTPVVLPMRITDELTAMLRKYHPIWVNTHFNHPNELTDEAVAACGRLADAGIPLGNQSVLLCGVNDCVHVMRKVVNGLAYMRVRPYYIYQCDLSLGLTHFRTPVSKGLEIIEGLRGHTSGFCVPTYVVDAPGGGGKIPVMPDYLISQSPDRIVLRNFEGVITTYKEPENYKNECKCSGCQEEQEELTGVAALLAGQQMTLEPIGLPRNQRKHKE